MSNINSAMLAVGLFNYRFTFYQVSYSLIFLLGLLTNSLALRKLCQSPCRVNSTAIYMISLSAGAVSSKTGDMSSWTSGAVFCQLTFTLKYISMYGGIFFLVCIAVDRYFAVVHPLASSLRRLHVAQLVSGGMWCLVLGLSVSLPLLRSAASHSHQPCLLDPSLQHHRTIILVALSLVLASFLPPTVLLLYSYCKVLSVLRQPRRCSRSQRCNHQHTLRVIYWVLAIYLLCFLPYHINLLGYTLTNLGLLPHCGLAKVTMALHPVVLTLASSNCCFNPLIYYFSSRLVHKEASSKTTSDYFFR
uniref:G-protein coupled receptors family 1 profile domain-containing protein n=1 Tax=Sparus aurata TaxID=8175 RepID=A0A671W379_SPAAU